MSIHRAATGTIDQGPVRQLFGYRGNTIFSTIDLVLCEEDPSGRCKEFIPPSNTALGGVDIRSGFGTIGTIKSGYEIPPGITKPHIDIAPSDNIISKLHSAFNLNAYPAITPPSKGTPICFFNGKKGKITSKGLVSRRYRGSVDSLDVYEVDFGRLDESLHGSQIYVGNSPGNRLLGMLISTSSSASGISLVFPADQIR